MAVLHETPTQSFSPHLETSQSLQYNIPISTVILKMSGKAANKAPGLASEVPRLEHHWMLLFQVLQLTAESPRKESPEHAIHTALKAQLNVSL